MEKYEEKLGFAKALEDISREYSAYATEVERFLQTQTSPETQALKARLDGVKEEFGVERTETENGEVFGKAFRRE